jgi:DNA invertase Pin-like site-specific DNA recombinase
MKVYYHRTSTETQHGKSVELEEKKKYFDEVLFDRGVSGTTDLFDRKNGKRLKELVESGQCNTLVVYKLDRLFRSMSNGVKVLDWLDSHQVNIQIESMGINSRVDGKRNKMFDLVKFLLVQISEWERENILERTRIGRERKIRETGKWGREVGTKETYQKFMNKPKNQEILKYLNKGYTYEEIKKLVDCSNGTISKVKKIKKIFEHNKKQGVHANQLDLVIESEKQNQKSLEIHLGEQRKVDGFNDEIKTIKEENDGVEVFENNDLFNQVLDRLEEQQKTFQQNRKNLNDTEVMSWEEIYVERLKELNKENNGGV